jgi:hypothetical protein
MTTSGRGDSDDDRGGVGDSDFDDFDGEVDGDT